MSELVIGLTIVAGGTSAPELVTSVVAAWRKQPEMSVGNILGSNVFNIFGILGITALVHPQTVACNGRADSIVVDLPPLASVFFEWSA